MGHEELFFMMQSLGQSLRIHPSKLKFPFVSHHMSHVLLVCCLRTPISRRVSHRRVSHKKAESSCCEVLVCAMHRWHFFSQNIGITLIGRFTLVGYDNVWLVAATTNNFHIHICSLEIYKSAHVGSRCHIRSGLCWAYFVVACLYLPQGWPQQLQHVGDVDDKLKACVLQYSLLYFSTIFHCDHFAVVQASLVCVWRPFLTR